MELILLLREWLENIRPVSWSDASHPAQLMSVSADCLWKSDIFFSKLTKISKKLVFMLVEDSMKDKNIIHARS